MLTLRQARDHGVAIDEAAFRDIAVKSLQRYTGLDRAIQTVDISDITSGDGPRFGGAREAGLPRSAAKL